MAVNLADEQEIVWMDPSARDLPYVRVVEDQLHPRQAAVRVNHAVVGCAVAVRTSDAPSAAQDLGGKAHLGPLAFLLGGKFCGHRKEMKTTEYAEDAEESPV